MRRARSYYTRVENIETNYGIIINPNKLNHDCDLKSRSKEETTSVNISLQVSASVFDSVQKLLLITTVDSTVCTRPKSRYNKK